MFHGAEGEWGSQENYLERGLGDERHMQSARLSISKSWIYVCAQPAQSTVQA